MFLMEVAPSKTEAMHVEPAAEVEAVTGQVLQQLAEEGVLQHVCSCGEPFCSKHALQQHQSSCTAQNEEYDLQEILEVRGSPEERLFLCHRVGFEPDESTGDATWEPPENLSQQQMDVFWDALLRKVMRNLSLS